MILLRFHVLTLSKTFELSDGTPMTDKHFREKIIYRRTKLRSGSFFQVWKLFLELFFIFTIAFNPSFFSKTYF